MTPLRIGSLFSGCGGLDMATEAFYGATTAWVSDIDKGACKILAHRYPDVPNIGDITSVDWAALEPVDVLTGGFPCQDVSHAGKRAGMRPDTRSGLWTHMAYAVSILRPRYVVVENVRGLLSAAAHSSVEPCAWCVGGAGDGEPDLRALGAVLGDLADLGYDAQWVGLRAADVGAPHGRFRVFVVAEDVSARVLPSAPEDAGVRAKRAGGGGWSTPADALGRGLNGRAPESVGGPIVGAPAAGCSAGAATDAERGGRDGRTGTPGQGRRLQPADSSQPAADATSSQGGIGHGDDVLARRGTVGREPATGGSAAADAHDAADDRERACPRPELGTAADPDSAFQRRRTTRGYDGLRSEGLEPSGLQWGAYEPAIRRWEAVLGRVAPAPTETSPRGAQRLSPAFVEWMQGLPAGHVTAVPGLTRNEQLKALGNGVVPQQALAALQMMHVGSAVAA